VPLLKLRSLSAARGLLHKAGCTLGNVRKPQHKPKHSPGKHKAWKLLVIRQSAPAKRTEPAGDRIAVSLGWIKIKH
jgi:hypothetical protein